MNTPSLIFLLIIFSFSCAAFANKHKDFLECFSLEFQNYSSISNIVYTKSNSSYTGILQFSIQNLRFMSNSTPKPLVITTPKHESQIPPVIYCAKQTGLEIRTRSGGHDFEGLSYAAKVPFVIIDLINLSEVTVDIEDKTAWVEAGATIGSLYYQIAEKSPILGFPAGLCPTVGVGGHLSGGGYGPLLRKYGLAADNVVDARIVDVNGRFLDRKSMGEDLFWAIRGGGGASFGVIVAWKVQLVDVPVKVTVFTVSRTLEQHETQLIHRWQYVAPTSNQDMIIGVIITKLNSTVVVASFFSMFLGPIDRLLPVMHEIFPELGLTRKDCTEMSWIQSVLYLSGFAIDSPQVLLNRTQRSGSERYFKGKSDFVQKPIPRHGLEGLLRLFHDPKIQEPVVLLYPYGGRMSEISFSAIPYPHRAGNLYKMAELVYWKEEDAKNSDMYISWIRRLHHYLTPYTSNSPRAAYYNYRDLDLGVNNIEGETSYAQASIWGKKYFGNNFDRLVRVKTIVDPDNFFRNEQSIPPLR